MKRSTKLLAAVAAVAVLVGTAVAAIGAATTSAQEPTATPAPTQSRPRVQNFLEKLAANLNITVDQLTQAIKTTELQIVDQMLTDGKINTDQAQQLKDRINNGQGLGLGRILGAYKRGRQDGARLQRLKAGIVKSASTAIGVQPSDLRQELRSGKSIADVAAQHNVSIDAVKAQITSDAKAALNQAVQDGKITQPRADEILQKLTAKLDDILNKKKSA